MADVPAGADVVGSPAQPVQEFFRQVAVLRRLVREATGQAAEGQGFGDGDRHGLNAMDAPQRLQAASAEAIGRGGRTSRASCTRSRIAIRS